MASDMSNLHHSTDATSQNGDERSRYLCFSLGNEEFAIPLLQVKTVTGLPDVTKVPNTPNYFMGIMNLRGQIISVLDLRKKMGVTPKENAEIAVIIIEFSGHQVGLVVDSINSVLSPLQSELQPRPEMMGGKNADSVSAVYTKESRIVMLLDILKSLGAEDKSAFEKAQAKAA